MTEQRPSCNNILDSVKKSLSDKIGLKRLLGNAPSFRQVKDQIPSVAQCDVTVLITGETGTGKELCARAIHYLSSRSDKPFFPLNFGAIPGELFENELFGHNRGAFTDAHAFQSGVVTEAEGGTLFLDEISCVSTSAQSKLLRFLEEKKFKPLGCNTYIESDVRIIAATNEDLKQKTKDGSFREDLFYRLKVVSLSLPPLRKRKEDIPILTAHFLDRYCRIHNNGEKSLSPRAMQKLYLYDWPGNIRELENVIQQAVVLTPVSVIQPCNLNIDGPTSLQKGASRIPFKQAKAKVIEKFEREYISELLMAHAGNITHAAKEAGIDRWAFWRLMKKYHINKSYLSV